MTARYSRMPLGCLWIGVLALSQLVLGGSTARAQGKTDVIVLGNGDRVTCEIETLERGRLTVDTDSMGTLQIEWDDVQQITSTATFDVELETGQRFIGSLGAAASGQIVVIGEIDTLLDRNSVVRIRQIGAGFWSQIDGSMDVGVNFTKANESKQWSFAGEGLRRTEGFETRVTLSSLFSSQEGIDATSRHMLGVQVNRFLGRRWLAATVGQFQQNEELDLDFRALIGGGVGRYLVQTNHTIVYVLGGLDVLWERFAGPEPGVINAEALTMLSFQRFTFDDPETDFSATLVVLPSLTEAGRVRIDFDTRIRREILKDFYWSISAFTNFDSNPPSAATETNDYDAGLISSFGWSF